MLLALLVCFLSFLWNVAEYHVLYEDNKTNFCQQILLMPYYASHFLFRSITIASFHIYFYSKVVMNINVRSVFIWGRKGASVMTCWFPARTCPISAG